MSQSVSTAAHNVWHLFPDSVQLALPTAQMDLGEDTKTLALHVIFWFG